ncbi:MAG: bifunctional phosphoribosylaminoimidazolecarboxamide formyltransferase/IMP cyclohydrolase [Thermoplasmata archaeon]
MNIIVSVTDKRNIEKFVQFLIEKGNEIYATSGTKRYLEENKIKNINDMESITGFKEMLDGRVKTLHPNIYAGILARNDQINELKRLGIKPIDMVVVNLYDFKNTGDDEREMVENIDIGGVSLIRAAAKNYERVTVITDPDNYDEIIREIGENGYVGMEKRKELAVKAFLYTSWYDSNIFNRFWNKFHSTIPPGITVSSMIYEKLRYGENPHDIAGFYSDSIPWKYIRGKEISYNNILDMDVAWKIVNDFDEPAVAIIKHGNPCGVSSGQKIDIVYDHAFLADSMSAYGGIIGVNFKVNESFAKKMRNNFYELIVAPDYDENSIEFFSKYKKDLRVIKFDGRTENFDLRNAAGGFLYQIKGNDEIEWNVVTERKPDKREEEDLRFSWNVVRHVKSNAIVFAFNKTTTGIGAGQMSRVDAVKIASMKAGERAKNSVMASDGFLPFVDDVEEAAKAGITAIIQPGGSKRDNEVIKRADELNIAMVFTGKRAFSH